MHRAICWLRRDLRLSDHAPLALASEQADQVAVLFVFDQEILSALADPDDARVSFIHASLAEVDTELRKRGSRLVVAHGDPVELVPQIAEAWGAQAVLAGDDNEPYARLRDQEVAQRLAKNGCDLQLIKDHVVFHKDEVLNGSGDPFKVYTPFMKAWRSRLTRSDYQEHRPNPARFAPAADLGDGWHLPALQETGFLPGRPWTKPGEAAAQDRLSEFLRKMPEYGEKRDMVDAEGTSGMSVHLRFGTISIRACVRAALAHPGAGADKWLNELIWREFYQSVLWHFPHVVEHTFRPEFDRIDWPGLPEHYEAWESGRTGYPIVDAAMRCLNQTGWMHNRLRMVVASFLVKDLLLDYRMGEKHFARKLLDFDLAQNNGGWQWAASTGVDAQPTFRIFNPILQSRKFDPQGSFIRKWVPELAHLDDELIHWPHEGLFASSGYRPPIVDHAVQREHALNLLGSVRQPVL